MEAELVQLIHDIRLYKSQNIKEEENRLLELMHGSPSEFLGCLMEIMNSGNLELPDQKLALILAGNVFPRIVNPEEQPFLEILGEELVSNMLDFSYNHFQEETDYATLCARLFTIIATHDLNTTNTFDTISTLSTNYSSEDVTPSTIQMISQVLSDLCEDSMLEEETVGPILETVYKHIGNEDIKIQHSAISVLYSIIVHISEILSDDSNLEPLFTSLLTALEKPELKFDTYQVWIQLIENYYPLLSNCIESVAPIALADLESEDRDILLGATMFWESLAQAECPLNNKDTKVVNAEEEEDGDEAQARADEDSNLGVIAACANELLVALYKVGATCPEDVVSDDTEFEPWTVATTAMQFSVVAAPSEAYPVLLALVSETVESEEFGLREVNLAVIGSIIEASDCDVRNPSDLMDELCTIINARLTDDSVRVRHKALLCVHTLLLNILEKGDDCAFSGVVKDIAPHILEMAEKVVALMTEDNENIATACLTAVDFVRFPGFPFIAKTVANMYRLAVVPDAIISIAAFSALSRVVECVHPAVLKVTVEWTLNVLEEAEGSYAESQDPFIITQTCGLLNKLFFRLKGEVDEVAPRAYELLSGAFSLNEELATHILIPIASLARAASPEVFSPFIGSSVEFIMQSLAIPSPECVANAAVAVSFLSDTYSLAEHVPPIVGALAEAMSNSEFDILSKRFIADAIKDIAKSNPSEFADSCGECVAALIATAESIGDYLDELEAEQKDEDVTSSFESLLISFLCAIDQCIAVTTERGNTFEEIVNDLLSEAINVLEIACGMQSLSPTLVGEVVLAIAFLIEHFPEQMTEFMDNEPGFSVVISFAVAGRIELEALQKVVNFVSGQQGTE